MLGAVEMACDDTHPPQPQTVPRIFCWPLGQLEQVQLPGAQEQEPEPQELARAEGEWGCGGGNDGQHSNVMETISMATSSKRHSPGGGVLGGRLSASASHFDVRGMWLVMCVCVLSCAMRRRVIGMWRDGEEKA